MAEIHKLPTTIFREARDQGADIDDALLLVANAFFNMTQNQFRAIAKVETMRPARIAMAKLNELDALKPPPAGCRMTDSGKASTTPDRQLR